MFWVLGCWNADIIAMNLLVDKVKPEVPGAFLLVRAVRVEWL